MLRGFPLFIPAALNPAQERRASKDYAEGFAVLDLDGGAPWDLLCALMQAAPRRRLSAARATGHPALGGGFGGAVTSALTRLGDATDRVRAAWSGTALRAAHSRERSSCALQGLVGVH